MQTEVLHTVHIATGTSSVTVWSTGTLNNYVGKLEFHNSVNVIGFVKQTV
jgi:hypothetical protein